MSAYEAAHELARRIKESDEYLRFHEQKNLLEGMPELKKELDDFHQLQSRLQKQHILSQSIDAQDEKAWHDKLEALRSEPVAMTYLEAEMRFAQMMADISRIIADI